VASLKRFVRAVGRALLWPLSRFFDPRFHGIARQGEVHHEDLARRVEGTQARVDERHDQTVALVEGARAGILEAVDELKGLTTADMDAAAEANELIGRSLADLLAEVERLSRRLDELQQRMDESAG
jgi:hypothetical protein